MYHYLFENYGGVSTEELRASFEGRDSGNPSIDLVRFAASSFTESFGGTEDPEVIMRQAVTLWSTIHGIGHLSVVGILRHQHAVVRRYTIDAVLTSVLSSMRQALTGEDAVEVSPLLPQLREMIEQFEAGQPDYSNVTIDADTDEDTVRHAVMAAARTIVGSRGADALSLRAVADLLGISEARVVRAAENEFTLREHTEVTTDQELATHAGLLLSSLPEDATARDHLRAFAVAYFNYGVHNPVRFNAMIALASKSVVSTAGNGPKSEMSPAFQVFVDLTRNALAESGIEATDNQVYIKSMILWAGGNGITHLCAAGNLRELDLESKWALFSKIIETVIGSFADGLDEID